ncbi:MAG TPA: hypothetical protein VKB08_09225 [Bradyrhizobium sp.]|nr:hypothetical protein [Bradyrhizobium sp.]
MRRLAIFLTMMAIAVPAPLVLSAPVHAAANPNVAFCKDYVGSDPTIDPNLNRGECVSLLNSYDNYYKNGSNSHAVAVHECDYFAENYPADFDLIWGSRKACIADIESGL